MSRCFAFLRGINLGKRTVKMDELRVAFETLGFSGVRTLIASGNVAFDGRPDSDTRATLEKGLEEQFGFPIGVVLRSLDQLRAMIETGPFGTRRSDAETKLYLYLLDAPVAEALEEPREVAGDYRIISAKGTEIYAEAYRQDSGRFGSGLDKLGKGLPRGTLVTNRNWNTILRLVEKEGA